MKAFHNLSEYNTHLQSSAAFTVQLAVNEPFLADFFM